MFNRQSLKDDPFKTFTAASETEIERFWEIIQLVDDSITYEDRTAEQIKRRVSRILIELFKKDLDHLINLSLSKVTSTKVHGTLLHVKALLLFNKKMW